MPQTIVNGRNRSEAKSPMYVTRDDDSEAPADDDDDDDDEDADDEDGKSWLNFFTAVLVPDCIFI